MKTTFLFAMLLAASSFCQAPSSANRSAVAKNFLALYFVCSDVPNESLANGTAGPDGLKLAPKPILSDPDFVGWDMTNHTFVITPAAAIRVGLECSFKIIPFVLVAEGVPIYLGEFKTGVSSISCSVPVIQADLAVAECFMGVDKVPADIWRMVGTCGPGALDRLMELARTRPTTNVSLSIDPGYFCFSPQELKEVEKRRGDPRIAPAVQKLFGSRQN